MVHLPVVSFVNSLLEQLICHRQDLRGFRSGYTQRRLKNKWVYSVCLSIPCTTPLFNVTVKCKFLNTVSKQFVSSIEAVYSGCVCSCICADTMCGLQCFPLLYKPTARKTQTQPVLHIKPPKNATADGIATTQKPHAPRKYV